MKRFAKALALFGTGSAIGTLAQIIKGKLGAIFLGVDGVGVFNQLTNAWSLLYTISGLGIYNGVVQKISEAHSIDADDPIREQFTTSLLLVSGSSIFITVVSALFARDISNLLFNDAGSRAEIIMLALISIPIAVGSQIYQGLFSGCRLVRQIVFIQIATDIVSAILFFFLVLASNLWGATLAFSISHIVKLGLQIFYARDLIQFEYLSFNLKSVKKRIVSENFGFGISGLVLVSLGVLTTTVVYRWVVGALGDSAGGLFSVAWRVCGLYFGALYASASGYYFPQLSAAKKDGDLVALVNEAVTVYMYALTPIAIGVVIAGPELMKVLFSSEFAPAAMLLLWFLPGDFLRMTSETVGLSMLAKRKLIPYSLLYVGWSLEYLLLVWLLLPSFGLGAVGIAYFVSHAVNLVVCIALTHKFFSFRFFGHATLSIASGFFAVALASLFVFVNVDYRSLNYLAGIFIFVGWFFLNWQVTEFRALVEALYSKMKSLII